MERKELSSDGYILPRIFLIGNPLLILGVYFNIMDKHPSGEHLINIDEDILEEFSDIDLIKNAETFLKEQIKIINGTSTKRILYGCENYNDPRDRLTLAMANELIAALKAEAVYYGIQTEDYILN